VSSAKAAFEIKSYSASRRLAVRSSGRRHDHDNSHGHDNHHGHFLSRDRTAVCGIVGFTGRDPELLDAMLASIEHRGPDSWGAEVGEEFTVG